MDRIKKTIQGREAKVTFTNTKQLDWKKQESFSKTETQNKNIKSGFGSVDGSGKIIFSKKFPNTGEEQRNVRYRKKISGHSDASKEGFKKFVKETKDKEESFQIILQAAKNARVPAYPLMKILREENIKVNPEHLERYLSGFLNVKGELATRTERVSYIKRYYKIE